MQWRPGGLGAQAGDRAGGIRHGLGHGGADVAVAAPVMNEATDEGIACAGGVARGNRQAGNLELAFLADVQRALLAEGHDDVANAVGDQGLGGFMGRRRGVHDLAGDQRQLGFVGHQEIQVRQMLTAQAGQRWRRVEQDWNVVRAAEFDGVVNGVDIDFQLQNDQRALAQRLGRRVDIRRNQVRVGAFDDEDAVVRVGLDEDRRHTAGHAGHALHVTGVDTKTLEIGQGVVGKHVIADLGEHQHIRPELRRGNRLIGALAAAPEGKPRRFERLTLGRHAVDVGDQIHHIAADDCDLAHCYPTLIRLARLMLDVVVLLFK
ncbi:hypothetical protein BOO94_09535 [Pseudomonas sp. FSL W5-0299]|nr:hypothetical protein BOO94_09535 [Pseudomonas sp. FSL W5-0299]